MNNMPIFDKLTAAADKVQDGVADFQLAVDELQDFGKRLRSMTDRLQARHGSLDDVVGDNEPMKLPRAITPPLQRVAENVEAELQPAPKRARA